MIPISARIDKLISRERRRSLRSTYERYRDDGTLGSPVAFLHVCYVRELPDVLDRLEEDKEKDTP